MNINMFRKINIFKNISKLDVIRVRGVNGLNNNSLSLNTTEQLKEQKIQIGKHNINYLKVGSGPHNLIFTPGGFGSIWTSYRIQIEHFDRSKFTLVVWDPPGYGRSRPPGRDYTWNNYENDADVAYQLMKKLKIPKYSALGWSAGGSTSLILAAKYPDVIAKLVVWNTNVFSLPHEREALRSVRDISTWNANYREAMIKVYGKKLAQYSAEWVDCMTAARDANMEICTKYLKYIKCPTMVLYGNKDPIVDEIQVTYLEQILKNCIVHKYPEGKHNIHIREAEDFNKRVQDFLLSN